MVVIKVRPHASSPQLPGRVRCGFLVGFLFYLADGLPKSKYVVTSSRFGSSSPHTRRYFRRPIGPVAFGLIKVVQLVHCWSQCSPARPCDSCPCCELGSPES